VVWTFRVQADVPTIIPELQLVILKIWTIPHITNVGEAGTQDGSVFHTFNTFILHWKQSADTTDYNKI
jgi:hypothetical protein